MVIQFRENFLGDDFFKLKEMDPIVSLLRRSASGLAFGHTRTGRAVAQKMSDFLSLSRPRRVIALLNILLDLAGEADAKILSTNRVQPICR